MRDGYSERMASMPYVTKTTRRSGARFTKVPSGSRVRVSPKGGVRIGPTHCESKRKGFATAYSYR